MSTSFVDFQPKENNNEASESVDDELGKDENSTLIKLKGNTNDKSLVSILRQTEVCL